VKQEETAVAKQRHGNEVFTATNKHATIEELLEVLCSSSQGYLEDQQQMVMSPMGIRTKNHCAWKGQQQSRQSQRERESESERECQWLPEPADSKI
jgi:hypothetical protein